MHAGIDLGGHQLHISVVSSNKVIVATHIKLPDSNHTPKNLDNIFKKTSTFLKTYGVDKVIIERALVFPGRGYPVFEMAEMMCIAKLAANKIKAEVVLVTPSQWRKNVMNNGKASKKDAIDYCKKIGWETKDHNEAESICIAFYQ